MILTELPTGHRNGRLVIIEFVRDPKKPKHPFYRCQCDCGRTVKVNRANLRRTHSCGCLRVEQLVARSRTHGMSYTPEFKAWCSIRERCGNPNRSDYARYGGSGITVCERWLESFDAFFADMGRRPSRKHSIDRIDPNGRYEPSNCRWANATQQRTNQRRTKLHTFQGFTGTLKQLSERHGISYTALVQRVNVLKWPLEKAVTMKVQRRKHGC